MNYIKHLTGFFDKVMTDELYPTHISLYIALFQFWNVQRFKNPISISRDEVMRVSKIASKATYHKCMRDLHDLKYLEYHPSFNPFIGSLVTIFDLELTHQQVQKKSRNKTNIQSTHEQALNKQQTGSEQALVPYINTTNIINNTNVVNGETHAQKNDPEQISLKTEEIKKENLREKKKVNPSLEEVKQHFSETNFPALEAEKFHNYFESNGWLVGGKTPMKNWKAAASNWILNSGKFDTGKTTHKAKNLHATTGKDYSEAL